MKVLNIAWKFDNDSAFSEGGNGLDDKNFFYAFKITDDSKKLDQIFPILGYFVGAVVFFFNRLKRVGLKPSSDQLITLVKRNYVNEIIINHMVNKYKIDIINLHWCGYGFLPTGSLDHIRNISQLNIFHHDWYHFTSGEHVPKILGGPGLSKSLRINSGLHGSVIQNIFVSSFQEEQVQSLRLPNWSIAENNLREAFVSASKLTASKDIYKKRIMKTSQFFILFVGVRPGNYDNKGIMSAQYILDELNNLDIFSIGIGCDESLPLSLSFNSLSPDEVYKIMSACDLTIITSRLETFSMVALESQFCKTPVVFRKSLAPSTFNDSSYLFPATDDSDNALLEAVINSMHIKRTI